MGSDERRKKMAAKNKGRVRRKKCMIKVDRKQHLILVEIR
jgi:hypothetical protein